jgi:hypothetical protein
VSGRDATHVTISGLGAVAAEAVSSGREPLAESEYITDGGVSHAGAYAEAFPGSCRSTGGTTPQSSMHDSDALTQLARAEDIGTYVGTC